MTDLEAARQSLHTFLERPPPHDKVFLAQAVLSVIRAVEALASEPAEVS